MLRAQKAKAAAAGKEFNSDEMYGDRLNEEVRDKLEKELSDAIATLWESADHPNLARYLRESEPLIAKLKLASRRPQYYYPMVSPDGRTSAAGNLGVLRAALPSFRAVRSGSSILAANATARLKVGDFDEYEDAIETLLRLSRLVDKDPSTLSHLIAIALDSRANVLASQPNRYLSVVQTDAIRQILAACPPLNPSARSLDYRERYNSLDIICSAKLCGFGASLGTDLPSQIRLFLVPVNLNVALRIVNTYEDRLVAAFALPTFAQRTAAYAKANRELDDFSGHGGLYWVTHPAELLGRNVTPIMGKVDELQTRATVDRSLALTALALRSCRLTKGTFPEHLEDLGQSGFTPPADPFSDAPFVYHREGNGYVLYSVGPNMKDDGGTARSEETKVDYDVVIREKD